MFEDRSKIIIGLERLMLEASGFDFRNRYPQRLVLKIAKYYKVEKDTVGKTAYNMSMDLYLTYAPLKQTTITLAMACVELSARVFRQVGPASDADKDYKRWQTSRPEVMGLYFFYCRFPRKSCHKCLLTLFDRNSTRPTGSIHPSQSRYSGWSRSHSRGFHQYPHNPKPRSLCPPVSPLYSRPAETGHEWHQSDQWRHEKQRSKRISVALESSG